MGRKKRRTDAAADDSGAVGGDEGEDDDVADISSSAAVIPQQQEPSVVVAVSRGEPAPKNVAIANEAPVPSNYAIKPHSGEILQEDIYVSDGSEDEDDDVDCVLAGSRMGVMRKGLTHPSLLVQPNRQWVRRTLATGGAITSEDNADDGAQLQEEQRRQQELEELAQLDPAQRAARLAMEKQRQEEHDREVARRLESEENAGRDPMLFSRRTAFDIRFDQIDDKPWERMGELADFFNYGLDETSWLEYGAQQLQIRQELMDAKREGRQPDPNILPVMPRLSADQGTAALSTEVGGDGGDNLNTGTTAAPDTGTLNDGGIAGAASTNNDAYAAPMGPSLPVERSHQDAAAVADGVTAAGDATMINVDNEFGAWGGGINDARLAQLMAEQENDFDDRSSVGDARSVGGESQYSYQRYGGGGGGGGGGGSGRGSGGGGGRDEYYGGRGGGNANYDAGFRDGGRGGGRFPGRLRGRGGRGRGGDYYGGGRGSGGDYYQGGNGRGWR